MPNLSKKTRRNINIILMLPKRDEIGERKGRFTQVFLSKEGKNTASEEFIDSIQVSETNGVRNT